MLLQHQHTSLQRRLGLPESLPDCDQRGAGLVSDKNVINISQDISDKNVIKVSQDMSDKNVIKISVWARLHMMLERSPVDRVALLAEAESRVAGCPEVSRGVGVRV